MEKLNSNLEMSKEELKVFDCVVNNTFKKLVDNWKWQKENILIKSVDKDIFAFINKKTSNVNFFLDKDWEVLFNLWHIKQRGYVASWEAFEEMRVYEIKENWVYNMYKVKDYKILDNWRKLPILWSKFSQTSKEYYQLQLDIMFLADIDDIKTMVETKMKDNIEGMRLFAKHGAFKFEDLETFKDNDMIDDDVYNYWIQELRKIVVSQCKDIRLIKKWRWIKESDIKKYLEKWYIDIELAKKCYEVLPKEMKNLKEE